MTFDLLTMKVVSESRVTWATSVLILVFLGLSVVDLGPMNATDVTDVTQTDVRRQRGSSLYTTPIRGGGITKLNTRLLKSRFFAYITYNIMIVHRPRTHSIEAAKHILKLRYFSRFHLVKRQHRTHVC